MGKEGRGSSGQRGRLGAGKKRISNEARTGEEGRKCTRTSRSARDTQPNARRNSAKPVIPRIDFQSALIAGPSLTKLFVLRDPVAEQPFDPLLPRFNAPPLIVSLPVPSPRCKCGVKEANSWSKCRARM